MQLQNAKIVLGVTGGIAAYKACELVRLLRRSEAAVRVVMSKEAERFVGPLTFASLSGNKVLRSLHEGVDDLSATSHIDLAQWGEALIVAPATANFLAKFANGICDDALLTEVLAFQGPILLAPAMNTRMWDASVTQENLERIKARGVHIVGPESGDLACGETGLGKMSEPVKILEALSTFAASSMMTSDDKQGAEIATSKSMAAPVANPTDLEAHKPLAGMKVLITSGPTRAYIDSIRFITNKSSGRMGYEIAKAAESLGADVCLVSGPVNPEYSTLDRGKTVKVETNQEMLDAALKELKDTDLVFAAAAVCDFDVENYTEGKIERKGAISIALNSSIDILASLAKKRNSKQVFVGFAAQPGDKQGQMNIARSKLERKAVDFIAMNDISRKDIGFDVDANEMHIFESGSEIRYSFLPLAPKDIIAKQLLELAMARWSRKQQEPIDAKEE